MRTLTPPRAAFLPGLPVRQFGEQLIFLLMCMAGWAALIMVITFGVSLFRPIEISGWALASQPIRWFALAIACYIGYSVFPLHVLHGQTRRDFLIRLAVYVPVYALVAGLAFAAFFFIEAGYYALMGWPHLADMGGLYSAPLQTPLVVLDTALIIGVWFAAGIALGGGWYRSALLGAILIVVGIVVTIFSAMTFDHSDLGPFRDLTLTRDGDPVLWVVMLVHLAAMALFGAITWRTLRTIPIHTKAEDA